MLLNTVLDVFYVIIMQFFILLSAALLLGVSTSSHAKGLGQLPLEKVQLPLEEVVVTAQTLDGSLSSLSVDEARAHLRQIPGGIGFVEVADYQNNFTQSLGDTLVFTPGVFADTSAQRESRISIRGSGLNSSFERRGINVYRDGVPITRASGITEFQEIDPLSVKYIEVFKGSNGIRFGSNALGGAINIVTPTGANSEAGSRLRLEAGSFSSTRLNLSTQGRTDKIDYYAALTRLDSDGFRAHSQVDSTYGFANLGFALTDAIETRFYVTKLDDQFELAGSTTLADAQDNPATALGSAFVPATLPFLGGPGLFSASDDDWDRNLRVERIANRTVVDFSQWQLEAGAWYANRSLDHAITRFAGIIVQQEDERGFSLRASNERSNENAALIWSAGARYNQSNTDAQVFRNVFGERGNQSSQDQQRADNLIAYAQLDFALNQRLRLIAGAQYTRAKRSNQHQPLNPFDNEDDSGSLTFNEFNPRLGLLWNINPRQQVYANLSRASEVPGISDLTAAGVLPFDPLEAQVSTTFELGTRGQNANLAWDVSVYRSNVENEFIDFTNGFVTNTVNATGDTIHQGLELGIDWLPKLTALSQYGLSLVWRHVLTLNDFNFDNDPIYANNALAGVPDLSYLSELNLSNERWSAGLNVRYVADGPFADFANTVQTDGYTLIGLNFSWQISDRSRVFVSGENLSDENYISNVSTVGLASDRSQIFTPGQGRAAYLGIDYQF